MGGKTAWERCLKGSREGEILKGVLRGPGPWVPEGSNPFVAWLSHFLQLPSKTQAWVPSDPSGWWWWWRAGEGVD